MKLRRIFSAILLCSVLLPLSAKPRRAQVTLYTTAGNIVIELYDETPSHRNNFLKQVKRGLYDGVLFHRVIKDFMIQTGDPLSRTAKPGEALGEGDEQPSDWLEPEFRLPQIFHHRGVVAAAREGDDVNPQQKSSSQQFYIVTGRTWDDTQLDAQIQQAARQKGDAPVLTPEMREAYRTIGGTPHLDGAYTVFGEVEEGLDIVEMIQSCATAHGDRPIDDIEMRMKVVDE